MNNKIIVLWHFGRSGSTVLGDLLDQHSSIKWFGEVFTLQSQTDNSHYMTAQSMYEYIRLATNKSFEGGKHCGIEIKPINFFSNPSCDMKDLVQILASDSDMVHIFLQRKNILKRIVSSHKALHTGKYHVKGIHESGQDEPKINTQKIMFDYWRDWDTNTVASNVLDLLENIEIVEQEVYSMINVMLGGLASLNYEDHIESDPLVAYKKVLQLLQLNHQKISIRFKPTSGGLDNDLINFKEIADELSGTRFSWMLGGRVPFRGV
jgi:hypothetical protein